jgi:hypothetical protein
MGSSVQIFKILCSRVSVCALVGQVDTLRKVGSSLLGLFVGFAVMCGMAKHQDEDRKADKGRATPRDGHVQLAKGEIAHVGVRGVCNRLSANWMVVHLPD